MRTGRAAAHGARHRRARHPAREPARPVRASRVHGPSPPTQVAKNVILANVNSVTLHDGHAATAADLGGNFYLSKSDVGKNRAAACSQQMQELNPAVRVTTLAGPFPRGADLEKYSIVVAIDVSLDEARSRRLFHTISAIIAYNHGDY